MNTSDIETCTSPCATAKTARNFKTATQGAGAARSEARPGGDIKGPTASLLASALVARTGTSGSLTGLRGDLNGTKIGDSEAGRGA